MGERFQLSDSIPLSSHNHLCVFGLAQTGISLPFTFHISTDISQNNYTLVQRKTFQLLCSRWSRRYTIRYGSELHIRAQVRQVFVGRYIYQARDDSDLPDQYRK